MIKKLILVLIGLFLTCSSRADFSGDYIYTHDISMWNGDKGYRVEDAKDTLAFKQVNSTTWNFDLFAIARSANMCDVSGQAIQINPILLEYKDNDCTLRFEKKDKKIHVSDIGAHCQKSCGRGVYLDGLLFSPKSKEILKPRQATPLRKVSNNNVKNLKGDWKDVITISYKPDSIIFDDLKLDELQWYQSKSKTNKYYLFSIEQPFFIILKHKDKEKWEFINIWKINYPENEDDWKIYPALYPISDHQDAIALVYHGSESYSGGAAGFDVAKIIPLNASNSTLSFSKEIVTAMPFSCSALTRACKSSEETEKFDDVNGKSRCHNVGSGYLTLKTEHSSNRNQKYYNWQLTWHERFLEGLSTSPEQKTKQKITINLNDAKKASCSTFDSFNFCGGGQEEYCLIAESSE